MAAKIVVWGDFTPPPTRVNVYIRSGVYSYARLHQLTEYDLVGLAVWGAFRGLRHPGIRH